MVNIKYIMFYLLIINLVSFVLFFIDKQKAKRDTWRIKESTLHLAGFMGGIIGSIAAMILFHHKTKKPKFVIITIIALLFNILMAYKFLIVPILTNRWYNYNIDFLSYYKKWRSNNYGI